MGDLEDGGMGSDLSDPDWGRMMISPPGKLAKVGDSTRWGSEVATNIDVSNTFFSEQVIYVETRDPYSRSWSLLGTLTMPSVTWGSTDMLVALEVTMGVGQIKTTQRIALYAADAVTPRGLCITQLLTQGGPYPSVIEGANEKRSFSAIGALIGQSINIRALYLCANALLTLGMPARPSLSVIVTPYAAGAGL